MPADYKYVITLDVLAQGVAYDMHAIANLLESLSRAELDSQAQKAVIVAALVRIQTAHISAVEAFNRIDQRLPKDERGIAEELAPFVGDPGPKGVLDDGDYDDPDEVGQHDSIDY